MLLADDHRSDCRDDKTGRHSTTDAPYRRALQARSIGPLRNVVACARERHRDETSDPRVLERDAPRGEGYDPSRRCDIGPGNDGRGSPDADPEGARRWQAG